LENNIIQQDTKEKVLTNFDAQGSREERAFCNWMTSLGVPVRSIVEDLRTAIKILQVMEKISPGIVDWKKVNPNAKNTYAKTENANYCVTLAKQLKLSVVGIGGKDLIDGNKTSILSIVWQMMKLHVFSILKKIQLFKGKELSAEDMVSWANSKVKSSGKDSKIKDLKDSSLTSSLFLIDLLNAVRPSTVDYSFVTTGVSGEDKELNAKYTISVARKIGCCIFLLWEDIVEVQPRMILTFIGTIIQVANQGSSF